jgi:hypothetical protein
MPPDEPAASAAPAADSPTDPSTDDIVGDLLKDGTEPASEPVETDAADATDAEPDADEPEPDDAAPADEELSGDLAAARAAADAGELDKAFLLAFGKKPEELQPDNKAWTKWRAANNRVEAAHAAKEQKLQADTAEARQWFADERGKISATIEQLRPYEAHRQAALAFEKDGDPSHLVKLVELTAKMSWDEAQKVILTKQRRSPGERQLAEKLAELTRKLEETTAEKAKQNQQLTQQQIYAQDIQTIQAQVAKVPEIAKVPRYAERIYQVLVKTKGPTGLTLTPQAAAQRVLAAERKRLAAHPLLKSSKPTSPVSQAASTLAKARAAKRPVVATGAPLRRDSQNNGAKDPKALESTDDIVADILRQKAAQ